MSILNPGFNLTLRPMKYPQFYERYRMALRNTWSVEEVDFSIDVQDLRSKLLPSERHMVQRLVAFFATGDTIVSNNLVLNLYGMLNSPEARMYLSRQLFEEALHVQFYLTLLDTYIPDLDERAAAFRAVEEIPSIAAKARFMQKWMDGWAWDDRRDVEQGQLLNLICFASCVEGLFFFGAFAYVYFLRSRGLLHGLASGTSYIFRDESCHMAFAFEVVNVIRKESPHLLTPELERQVRAMLAEAVEVETGFAKDLLGQGVPGLSISDMRQYLEYTAQQRLANLGYKHNPAVRNPLAFMELQDVQELTNFFERRVSAYQTNVTGTVRFDEEF